MKRDNFRKDSYTVTDEEEEAKKLSDMEIIQIAGGRAKNADKFNKLYGKIKEL